MANKVIDPAPIIKKLADRCLEAKGIECTILGKLIDELRAEPGVDAVEVVHGRWNNLGGHSKMDLRCSVCNKRASNFVGGYEDWWDLWMPNYCPNCGAKMDGGNEDG